MGVSINGGAHKWMVYSGKSQSKMDDDWGYPYFEKPPYVSYNVNPGSINHRLLTKGIPPNSHNMILKWYTPN